MKQNSLLPTEYQNHTSKLLSTGEARHNYLALLQDTPNLVMPFRQEVGLKGYVASSQQLSILPTCTVSETNQSLLSLYTLPVPFVLETH